MRKNLRAEDIANCVRMTRSMHKGTIMLVEGPHDSRVYSRFVNVSQCKVIVAHGKDNALDALESVEGTGFDGILAIVDRDFWKLDGFTPENTNVLLTDSHDLETMIVASPAFDKVLVEFGSEKKIESFRTKHSDIRSFVLLGVREIGCLRWYSLKENLSLDFEDLVFTKFVDKVSLRVDVPRMIKTVINHSGKHTLNCTKIFDMLGNMCDKNYDLWNICCGNDVVNFLKIGFIKVLGSHSAAKLKADDIGRALRLAYEETYFQQTELYQAMLHWQETHNTFVLI